mmetsp:Transcript_36684/g.72130  ORF Transcript_36684/g.72130 Transcript_36684/m.72130 type:complete len:85 (-) Transcript_36684:27-281(-)
MGEDGKKLGDWNSDMRDRASGAIESLHSQISDAYSSDAVLGRSHDVRALRGPVVSAAKNARAPCGTARAKINRSTRRIETIISV